MALLLGGPAGLSLAQTIASPQVPAPTDLSFTGVSNGQLGFYASTAGREAATFLAFDLAGASTSSVTVVAPSGEPSTGALLAQATSGSVQQVSQLLSLSGTTVDLAATLLTVSVVPGYYEGEASASAAPAGGATGLGQPAGPSGPDGNPGESADVPGPEVLPLAAVARTLFPVDRLPAWEGLSSGLDQAWAEVRAAIRALGVGSPADRDRSAPVRPADRSLAGPPALSPSPSPSRAGDKAGAEEAQPTAAIDHRESGNAAAIDAALDDWDFWRPGDSALEGPARISRDSPARFEGRVSVKIVAGMAASIAAVGAAAVPAARWARRRRTATLPVHASR
jgi:hypothetical protein